MSGKTPIVRARNLTVRFGDSLVLDDVSLDVYEGEILVVLGVSGCGKTTLLRCLVGLLRPDSGDVWVDGVDIVRAGALEMERVRRRFGVLFQSGALLKSMTLAENVALPLRESTPLGEDLIEDLVEMKLAMVNLDGRGPLLPSELSGGMQKRGGLARAIALDPRILFFDEPSAGLDPVTSAEIDGLILGLHRALGTTMVVVTHELQSIYAIAERAIMLDHETHRIVAEGNPAELRDQSSHPRVRAFFRREALAAGRGGGDAPR